MTRFSKWVALMFVVLAAGCGLINSTRGSGKIASEDRKVNGFDSVSLSGTGKLMVDQNGTEALSITADDNLLPLITSEVKGSQLVLAVKEGTSLDPTKDIIFKVSAKNLVGITLAGDASAEAKGIHTDALRMNIAGSGDIAAVGTAERQDITIAGSGAYRGADLKTKVTTINIAGSGDAAVAASDSLDIKIAGSGSIKYSGDPRVTQSVLGSGSVSKQ